MTDKKKQRRGTTPATSRSSPRTLQRLEREARIIELRNRKMTLSQIGADLGISKQAVQVHLDRIMARSVDKTDTGAEKLRTRQLAEALELRGRLFDVINSDAEPVEIVAAVKALVGVQQHEAKLVGAFAPEKRELSGPNGGPLQTESKVAAVDLRRLDDAKLAQLEQLLIEAQPSEPTAEGEG